MTPTCNPQRLMIPFLTLYIFLLGQFSNLAQAQDLRATVTQDEIDKSIKQAKEALLASVKANGQVKLVKGSAYENRLGQTALAGLALLEAGVPTDHPRMKALSARVRRLAVKDNNIYDVALAIMFLDSHIRHMPIDDDKVEGTVGAKKPPSKKLWSGRLVKGKSQLDDSELIRKLGDRLIMAQGKLGTWNYFLRPTADGDNSNTQFAILGVWIATLHGSKGQEALEKTGRFFERYVNGDGGWHYTTAIDLLLGQRLPPGVPSPAANRRSTLSMTAAGMVALACAQGAQALVDAKKPKNKPKFDKSQTAVLIKNAMRYSAKEMKKVSVKDYSIESANLRDDLKRQRRSPIQIRRKIFQYRDQYFRRVFYTYWSIERVGVFFNADNIDTLNWYEWGSAPLVQIQQPKGHWQGNHGAVCSTSFALLFLLKANISPDLSNVLGKRFSNNTVLQAKRPDQEEKPVPKPEPAKPKVNLAKVHRQLEKWRDAKGAQNTQQLADAVRQYQDSPLGKSAQQFLRQRMTRMTSNTLRIKITGDDHAVCLASLGAIEDRNKTDLIPDVIDTLSHADPAIQQQAVLTLQSLTKQDFGPAPNASFVERAKSINKWKTWYANQKP